MESKLTRQDPDTVGGKVAVKHTWVQSGDSLVGREKGGGRRARGQARRGEGAGVGIVSGMGLGA